MKIVPQKHTHFSLPVELQFQAIRTTWTPGKNSDGERVFFPAVSQNEKRRLAPVRDADEIRNQFFEMGDDEESVLDFLNSVGVWDAVSDMRGMDEITDPRVRAMRFQGTFGHRYFNARAWVMSVEYLAGARRFWRERFRNRAKLRADIRSSAPGDRFTLESNTLPIHLEWRGNHPHAIMQPLTGAELFTALAWVDVIKGRACKVCRECGREYTGGGSKYCDGVCERRFTKRAYRHRKRDAA